MVLNLNPINLVRDIDITEDTFKNIQDRIKKRKGEI